MSRVSEIRSRWQAGKAAGGQSSNRGQTNKRIAAGRMSPNRVGSPVRRHMGPRQHSQHSTFQLKSRPLAHLALIPHHPSFPSFPRPTFTPIRLPKLGSPRHSAPSCRLPIASRSGYHGDQFHPKRCHDTLRTTRTARATRRMEKRDSDRGIKDLCGVRS